MESEMFQFQLVSPCCIVGGVEERLSLRVAVLSFLDFSPYKSWPQCSVLLIYVKYYTECAY